jgi:hypothetical protein
MDEGEEGPVMLMKGQPNKAVHRRKRTALNSGWFSSFRNVLMLVTIRFG